MQETPIGLLLGLFIGVIVLGIGIVAAAIAYWRKGQSDKQKKTQPPIQQQQPRPQQPQPVAPSPQAEAPVQADEAPARPGEVMRVIRDEETGRVLVEVNGKQYAHIREIADARVGRRVLWAIADLVRFTGGMATNPQAVRSVAQTQPPPLQEPVQQPRSSVPASGSILDRLEQTPVSAPEPKPPALGPTLTPRPRPSYRPSVLQPEEKSRQGYSLIDYFRQGFEKSTPTTSIPSPTSFIDEIEEILQVHIRRLSTPLAIEVHVLTGPDGSLQIEIGPDAYSSAEEVPDPQIRRLIQDAVSEWEQS